ncbi:membrane protein insertase YidC [Lactococcus hircilactis]|uniref:Membrane protein insertase YidC n=1 Tax=Lactococcus hircilactis TaxID=1494462 RepID=A0A7X1Z9U2_9LACT|nr:YidC/Oxa1 family membrane protein insertase [Lactococcus hircilactis]MQW40511.1 membrane protein insertase YidC [Lactococcus hircilactis]
MKKKIALISIAASSLFVLTACGNSAVTSSSTNLWDQLVYGFAQIIRFLSFGGLTGVGIILFTIIIRAVLLPLMNMQIKSSQKMQEIQPEIKKLQAKYPGKDMESRRLMQEETQKLYAENKVNPYMGCLPLVVQMPVLWALYQALSRVDFLKHGTFLWFDIGAKDPTFILPVLAAVFTFLSSYLMMKSAPEKNAMTTSMTYIMPVFIFIMAVNIASGIGLYWVMSNAFQVFQTLLIANPWKILAARESKAQVLKDKEKARERAIKKAKKKK